MKKFLLFGTNFFLFLVMMMLHGLTCFGYGYADLEGHHDDILISLAKFFITHLVINVFLLLAFKIRETRIVV